MSEKMFWDRVRRAFRPSGPMSGRCLKLQDAFNGGLPDSHYQFLLGPTGWLELKWQPHWRRDVAGAWVPIELTAAQRRWLEEYARWGGNAYCLLGVGKEWALFRAPWVPDIAYQDRLEDQAVAHGWREADGLAGIVEALFQSRRPSFQGSPGMREGRQPVSF